MELLSVASRKTPQAAGRPKRLDKLFCFYSKKEPFLEPLGKYCIKWLPMLYYECGGLNGLGSPFGVETPKLSLIQQIGVMG